MEINAPLFLSVCLVAVPMAVLYRYILPSFSTLMERLVGIAVLPACFGAPVCLRGYTSRPQRWDLDLDDRQPVLFSFDTPFSEIKAYYIPPLQPSDARQVLVVYPGNTCAVGARMSAFWSHFGRNVHLILVNPCRYGTFEEDRSSPMTGQHYGLLEAWLRAIPDTLERVLLHPSQIDWKRFKPRTVVRYENEIKIDPCPTESLPKSFADLNVIAFGRSFGAFLAHCHTCAFKIYYTPFQGIAKLAPSGVYGILWKLLQPWTPFLSHDDIQSFLDTASFTLDDGQRQFLIEYKRKVFTGLTTNLDNNPDIGQTSLLVLATRENLVGRVDEEVQEADGVTVIKLEGDHGVLPDSSYIKAVQEYLEGCAKRHAIIDLGPK